MKTFNALNYLKIDVSNCYGNDKLTWEERLNWFNNNEPVLESYFNTADSPALYYAGVKAYRAYQANPNYTNTYPISLDATSSGRI